MKKFFLMILAVAALTLTGACSSSSDENSQSGLRKISSGRPDWNVDLMYNEKAPDWKAPDPAKYENWFIMMFRVQNELMSYVSDNDMVAIFIGDEMRALSHPARSMDASQTSTNNSIYYILKVYGNESAEEDIQLTLKLWSDKLHQTFTIKGNGKFLHEAVKGVNGDQLPNISLGSSKYPVTSLVNINFSPAKYGLEPSEGDMFAAFIGNECRGTVPPTLNSLTSGQIPLVVFGSKEGETVRVHYYNAKSNTVYDTGITFLTARNEENFILD